jgi:hypothetical protein
MFCSQCGSQASGNFCSKCGAPLAHAEPSAPDGATDRGAQGNDDWENEVRYEVLIKRPEVREMLARQSSAAPTPASSDGFLGVADKWLKPVVPYEILAGIMPTISARLGIRTGKERRDHLALKPGRVLVNTMGFLARHGYHPKTVQQATDGCTIEATVPANLMAPEGTLTVTVRRAGDGSEVDAAMEIKGQRFDYGKSHAILEELFQDLTKQPA